MSLTRGKFGELFYRLVVSDLKPHSKGLIVELGLLLDPNKDNLKDIETSLGDQARRQTMGGFQFGKFGFYVEEYKAAPYRFMYLG